MARAKAKVPDQGKPKRRVPLEGLVRYSCRKHGFLVDAIPEATVWCPCGKKATST